MKYFEFGQQNEKLMVMLHGGGVCYRGVLPVAERLLYQQATWRSWKNQDYCLINRPIDFSVFQRTDMHIWHGVNSSVEKKLARDIRKWQDAGYAFTYRAFHDVGHGGLAGEHTGRFMEEVKATHQLSIDKQKALHHGKGTVLI